MYKINIVYILIIVCLGSCTSKDSNKCSNSFESIYQNEKHKFSTSIKNDEKDTILNDIGAEGGAFGGEYNFFESGKIKQYRFFASYPNYTYAEYYSKEGFLDSTEGNPIVLSNVDEINKDSVKFNFYVFNLKKEITSFRINVNNSQWITLVGSPDSVFSNVSRFEFPFKAHKVVSIKIHEKLLYIGCNGTNREAIDSITIFPSQTSVQ